MSFIGLRKNPMRTGSTCCLKNTKPIILLNSPKNYYTKVVVRRLFVIFKKTENTRSWPRTPRLIFSWPWFAYSKNIILPFTATQAYSNPYNKPSRPTLAPSPAQTIFSSWIITKSSQKPPYKYCILPNMRNVLALNVESLILCEFLWLIIWPVCFPIGLFGFRSSTQGRIILNGWL